MNQLLRRIQSVLTTFHELILMLVLLILLVCTYSVFEAVRLNRLILEQYETYMKQQVHEIRQDVDLLKEEVSGR